MALTAQLTHFGVHATDLDRMVDFYTRVMGFIVSDSGTGRSGARVRLKHRPRHDSRLRSVVWSLP